MSPARRGGWRLPFSVLDVKLGARMLLKHPLMTVVSVISLAVGIPVGLAPTAAINALEAPLPVPQGERVLGLRHWNRERSMAVPASYYDLSLWRETLRSFEGLGAARLAEYNLESGTGMGGAISGAEVTASTFSLLRTRPLLGRALTADDEAIGGPAVVVLGYDLWQSRFGGDPGVVNRTVRIGDVVHTVVGVMPRGFLFPIRQDMWLPLRERPSGEPGRGAILQVFGRLRDGATAEQAEAELAVVQQRMSADFPEVYKLLRAEAVPFAIAFQGSPRGGWRSYPGTWAISVAAMILLGVACANVGLLIFTRTASRSAELSMRAALGADRRRIVAQVFTEVLVLAVVSTVLGLVLIELLSNRLIATLWSPAWGGLPWWIDLGVTPGMVAKALLLAVVSAALASIVPALRVTGSRMQESIRRAGATGSGVRLGPLSSAMIVVDMAMAVAVVGLVVGVSERMKAITEGQAGFPAEQFLSAEVTLSDFSLPFSLEDTLGSGARVPRLAPVQRALVERLQAEGVVRGVAVGDVLPRMDHGFTLAEVEGGIPGDRLGAHDADVAHVDPGFFAGLGQPVVAGRDFNAADVQGDRRAVIVNRTFVERTLGGKSAVGRRVRFRMPTDEEPGPWHEIVGVVPDLATNLTEPQNGLGVYHPAAPGEVYPIQLAIRVGPNPASFAPRFRELVSRVDPAAIVRVETLDKVFPPGWYMMAGLRIGWSVFVGILLVLAISGMYTMMALAVAQRTREIGIRTALGAPRSHVIATIGRRAAIQLGIGALIGMPLAGWIYFQVQEQYNTAAPSAVLVALVPGVAAMLLIGFFACTAPLLRALRITPLVAMRTEP